MFCSLVHSQMQGYAQLLKVVDPGGLILLVAERVFHYNYNRT
jgi:hypothetical protein